jgi:small subunit ribosomal protein S2
MSADSNSFVKDLIDAGIHFGQRRSNWNPRMRRYIYGERNKIHIIDIRQTVKGMLLASRFVEQVIAGGKDVCFVGTKRQARGAIEQYATDVSMPYVTERWLGGTLTNFRTIRERLKRLEELERLVASGEIDTYSKKMTSQLIREQRKITRNLEGIRSMSKLPGALIVVDVNREVNALREARSLGIPTICLIDTDGDPELADIPIPGNDDSMRSIEVVIRYLCEAINRGKQGRVAKAEGDEDSGRQGGSGRGSRPDRRSSRAQFSASASEASQPVDGGEAEAPTAGAAG